MSKSHYRLYLKPLKERPDFRLVITWLWKDFHNVDTDGNASNPASKEWTELYIRNRECTEETIEIEPISENPLVLQISASQKGLLYRITYFLNLVSEGGVSFDSEFKNMVLKENLIDKMEGFNLKKAQERVQNSIWQKATLENPYPNLKK